MEQERQESVQHSYEIQKILQEEIIDQKPHYLVKWKGFSAIQSTWEPIENLIEAIDVVHHWKVQKSSHTKHFNASMKPRNRKTKQIGSENKGHIASQNKIQKKLNAQLLPARQKMKKIADKILEQEQSTGYGELSSDYYEHRPHLTTRLSPSESYEPSRVESKIQQMRLSNCGIFDSSSPDIPRNMKNKAKKLNPKSTDKYFETFNKNSSKKSKADTKNKKRNSSKTKPNPTQDVNGFKVVGKITRQGIRKVLWLFDWQGEKICEVQLHDGSRANMRREDIVRICPQKLCDYLQTVVQMKQ